MRGEHYRLLCLSGDKKGISYYIDGKRLIIGRSNTAEVQILDEKASREHAEIARVQSNFIITDLSSQNGVVVNDLKIKNSIDSSQGIWLLLAQLCLSLSILK